MTLTVTFTAEVDFTDLTTRADCDKATDEVTYRLETFTTRDANNALAEKRTARSQAQEADTLARLDADISKVQGVLAATSPDDRDHQDAADDLIILQARRRKLARPDAETPGYLRFMADVTAGQGDGQIAFLQAVLNGIAAHRATLSA